MKRYRYRVTQESPTVWSAIVQYAYPSGYLASRSRLQNGFSSYGEAEAWCLEHIYQRQNFPVEHEWVEV